MADKMTIPGGLMGDVVRKAPAMDQVSLPPSFLTLGTEVRDEVLYRVKYKGYLEREQRQAAKLRDLEHWFVPAGFNYQGVPSLRLEARAKLQEIQPATLGQAGRISGITPADIALLMIWLRAKGEGAHVPRRT